MIKTFFTNIGDIKEWKCSKCKKDIWYGIKSKLFYCMACKKSCVPENAFFRCNEASHGLDFLEYQHLPLKNDLSQLRESKEINILILGETGVGKS